MEAVCSAARGIGQEVFTDGPMIKCPETPNLKVGKVLHISGTTEAKA